MEILKKRSKEFFQKALESFEKKEYNFVMFFVQQSLELFLKYLIAKKYGEFPKTHSLKILVSILNEKNINKIYKENENIIKQIEISYSLARYYDFEFSEEEAKKAIEVCKKILKND